MSRRIERVRMPHVERLLYSLSSRDWAIVDTIGRMRLVSAHQIERLYFHKLAAGSRAVVRARVLKRLVAARVLSPVERRVGAARRGSSPSVYALDSAGQRLLQLRANLETPETPLRRRHNFGERFVIHSLMVTELYVTLVEAARLGWFTLDTFVAEPSCWLPDGLGGSLKPDALIQLSQDGERYSWWYEADMATEHLTTIRRKLLTYLDFVNRGQIGPDGDMPWVVFGVPSAARLRAIQHVVGELPEPAAYMFRVAEFGGVVNLMAGELYS